MITSRDIFRESYIPQTILHRDQELRELQRGLAPAADGNAPAHALVSGRSGVGKTVAAKKVMRELRYNADVVTSHIHCLGHTAAQCLRTAIEEHPRGESGLVQHNTPADDVLSTLEEITERPYIVVFDEGDDLYNSRLIEYLTEVEGVSGLIICHNAQQWISEMSASEGKHVNTLVTFRSYEYENLVDILQARAAQGLHSDVVDESVLFEIAELSNGIARQAIQTLFEAAKLTEDKQNEKITSDVLPAAHARAKAAVRSGNLRSLPVGHQLVYHVIQQAGEVSAEDFHARYDEIASKALGEDTDATPVCKQTRLRYIEKLENYELVGHYGKKRGRTYFARDSDLTVPDRSPLCRSERQLLQ
jgi:Cdc6-like AAA superfamily ATPase